jgi:hypothetical protein
MKNEHCVPYCADTNGEVKIEGTSCRLLEFSLAHFEITGLRIFNQLGDRAIVNVNTVGPLLPVGTGPLFQVQFFITDVDVII